MDRQEQDEQQEQYGGHEEQLQQEQQLHQQHDSQAAELATQLLEQHRYEAKLETLLRRRQEREKG